MNRTKNPGPEDRGPENPEAARLLADWRAAVEEHLARLLPREELPPRELHAAMRYAVFPGGKRLRPLLVMAAAHLGDRAASALAGACAVELVHSYSLVHDDLPCMDDDELRRGRPTCHRVFGQAVALLAGNALLALAFGVLASYPGDLAGRLVEELARACGSQGLAGGQVGDLLWEPSPQSYDFVADAKTGALFRACLRMGGLLAGADPQTMEVLDRCGLHLGRAFQMRDDLDDWASGQDATGMNAAAIWGREEAERRADEEGQACLRLVRSLGYRSGALTYLVARAGAGYRRSI
ncbi:MAG: polyprenyl synthetase family protein [Bacillota bacterium]|nr:polyprenyl synthetase family protein [Bacillota bacterium]